MWLLLPYTFHCFKLKSRSKKRANSLQVDNRFFGKLPWDRFYKSSWPRIVLIGFDSHFETSLQLQISWGVCIVLYLTRSRTSVSYLVIGWCHVLGHIHKQVIYFVRFKLGLGQGLNSNQTFPLGPFKDYNVNFCLNIVIFLALLLIFFFFWNVLLITVWSGGFEPKTSGPKKHTDVS